MKNNFSFIVFFSYIILLFFLPNYSFSQSYKQKQADKEYENMRYPEASIMYKDLWSSDSANVLFAKKLADCYIKMSDSKSAEKVYRLLSNIIIDDGETALSYANVLALNGKYKEAKFWFDKTLQYFPNQDRPKKMSIFCENISQFFGDSSSYKIYYLPINSQQSDFSPVLYKDKLIFSSSRIEGTALKRVYARDNSSYIDIWMADSNIANKKLFTTKYIPDDNDSTGFSNFIEGSPLHSDESDNTSNDTKTLGFHGHLFESDKNWEISSSSCKPFSSMINTKYHEGPACFSGDSVIYFTRNNYYNLSVSKSSDKVNKLQILKSTFVKGAWGKAKKVSFCDRQYAYGHPCLTPNGKRMYFATDLIGSTGKTDIWYSDLDENGQWSSPINAGNSVNTEFDEMFPYIDSLGILYFSSNGHAGFGGLDIFKLDLNDAESRVKNLGFPINSKKDDFGYFSILGGKKGYISSNRKRGGTDDDIFMFLYKPRIKLNISVKYVYDEKPIKLVHTELVRKGKLGAGFTNDKGMFSYDALEPDKEYKLIVSKPTFVEQEIMISTKNVKAGDTINAVIYLDKVLLYTLEGTFTDKNFADANNYEPVILVNKTKGDTLKQIVDKNGRFGFQLEEESDYFIYGTHSSDKSNIESFTTKGLRQSTVIKAFLYLPTLSDCDKNKQKYFVENTYYDLAKFYLRNDAKVVLDKIVSFLKSDPDLKIYFSSHTDNRASSVFNKVLSEKRTSAVKDYLISNDISETRMLMESKGMEIQTTGNPDPKNPSYEKIQQLNRRTEYAYFKNGKNLSYEKCVNGLVISGKAFSAETKDPMELVKIKLTDPSGTIIGETTTDNSGAYSFPVAYNKEYLLAASKDSCGTNIQKVTTKGLKTKELIIDIPMICAGDIIKVDNIYFDLGKFAIRKDAAKELDKLLKLMKKYPNMKIELRSHTDARGSNESNMTLSDNRAKSSAAYVVSKGVSKERIVGKGYGESMPVNQCIDGVKCSEPDYQKNRRTEFKVLSIK